MSAELTASRQAMSHAKAAKSRGAEAYVPRLNEATKALERALNVSNPRGCARAAAEPVTFPSLALRARDGNETPLPEFDTLNLGRHGLLANCIQNTNCVSKVTATLVRDAAGLRLVALGKNEVAVVTPGGSTERLKKKGDAADVRIGDRIVLLAEAPPPGDEAFELIEVMDVEAPAAAPEIMHPPAAVDQARAGTFASGAQSVTAPSPAVPVLTLGATPAAPVEGRLGAPTQRSSPPRVEPPRSPLAARSPMKAVGDALPGQSVKKGRAAKGAVETVAKKMTPVEDRRAAEQRHRKVAAVLRELERYHVTAPEASVEAALEENDDNAYAAANCMIRRMEEFSVYRI